MRDLVAIIGPSGAGKSAAARELQRLGVIRVQPTWTTRPPRRDESVRSIDHVFVSDVLFDRLDAAGAFVATETLPGLAHRYGLRRPPDIAGAPVPAVIARTAQILTLRGLCDRLTVVAVVDTPERIAERLRARVLPAAETTARLTAMEAETADSISAADHVVVNCSSLGNLVSEIRSALTAEMAS